MARGPNDMPQPQLSLTGFFKELPGIFVVLAAISTVAIQYNSVTELGKMVAEFKTSVTATLKEMNTQLAAMPVYERRIGTLESGMVAHGVRSNEQDGAFSRLAQSSAVDHSNLERARDDLKGLMDQINKPLPGRR